MFYNVFMDTLIKLQEIAVHMALEPAEETGPMPAPPAVAPCGAVLAPTPDSRPRTVSERRAADKAASLGVTTAAMPGGKSIRLLKTLLTSACERNCHYCPFRAGRDQRRVTFTPDEMAKAFVDMHRAGAVEGLFLSSGIIGGGVRAQDKLLETVEIVRRKHAFRGYVHLKIMPGAEREQVRRAMMLADRLSVNLEAPTPARLADLAPLKQFADELLRPLRWMEEIRREEDAAAGWKGRWPSSTTQFVVGAVDETDLELLSVTEFLMRRAGLKRAYYSAFKPVPDTPLENHPAENPWREHRLYQASYLLRDYGFDLEEMPFTVDGRLPLDRDPKRAWAETNLREAPVELNRAEREELLRVPGVGPMSAAAIVRARRQATLRSLGDLREIGVRTKHLAPYVLLDGARPTYQLPLLGD